MVPNHAKRLICSNSFLPLPYSLFFRFSTFQGFATPLCLCDCKSVRLGLKFNVDLQKVAPNV